MNATVSAPQVDFRAVAELGDALLPRLSELREAEPISWNDSVAGWIVTRYADVRDGFDLKVPLSNDRFPPSYFDAIPAAERPARIPLTLTAQNWIIGVDPPQHTRLRGMAQKAFSRKVVEQLRPYAKEVIDQVLTEAGERTEVEFLEDVAVAITGRVMGRLLGFPEEHLHNLRRWSWDMNVALGPKRNEQLILQMEHSLQEMKAILDVEIESRRGHPKDDFLSELVLARDASGRLSNDELLGLCFVTLSAGHDTTAHSMTLGFRSLVRDPDARKRLVETPEHITDMVLEIMRFGAMSTTQVRVAAQDFVWHGKSIRKGDFLYLMIAAANRDPRAFKDPEELNLSRYDDRSSNRAVVFGGGIHYCIGHLLANMQLGEFFPEAFRRYPNARILEDKPIWQPSLVFRGLERLRVSFR
jgi:pimeloyl-[acyl-carrier protein] synthase